MKKLDNFYGESFGQKGSMNPFQTGVGMGPQTVSYDISAANNMESTEELIARVQSKFQ